MWRDVCLGADPSEGRRGDTTVSTTSEGGSVNKGDGNNTRGGYDSLADFEGTSIVNNEGEGLSNLGGVDDREAGEDKSGGGESSSNNRKLNGALAANAGKYGLASEGGGKGASGH